MKVLLKRMLIEDPIVVYEDEKIVDVLDNKMGEYNHLPVLNRDGQYIGIVSKVNIYPHVRAGHENKSVSEVVVPFKPVKLVERGESLLEDLLEVLKGSKFLFVPVVSEDGNLAGIIPNKEVLELFGKTIGQTEEGEIIEVTASDLSGTLNKIIQVFKDSKVNIIAINVLNLDVFNLRQVYIKFTGDKAVKNKMLGVLESLGFKSF